MRVLNVIGVVLTLLHIGCAGVASMQRMDLFENEERSYRLALRDSDFKTASHFLDPTAKAQAIDFDQFKMIKVARYKTHQVELSDDKMEIRQEVEIQYYFQTRPVLKTMQDHQVWVYHPDKQGWLLSSGLPKFK